MSAITVDELMSFAPLDQLFSGDSLQVQEVPAPSVPAAARPIVRNLSSDFLSTLDTLLTWDPNSVSEHALKAVVRNKQALEKISELESRFYEDYGVALAASSVNGLLTFLKVNDSTETPEISAESTGCIVAEWKSGPNSLAIRFASNVKVHFALALKKNEKIERPWGSSDIFNIFHVAPEARRVAERQIQ